MIKIIDTWTENMDNLKLVNFKMSNGDYTTIDWNSFKGSETTQVYIHKTHENEKGDFENQDYKVIIYKDIIHLGEDFRCVLDLAFYEKNNESIPIYIYTEQVKITGKQYLKPSKEYITKKIIKSLYRYIERS